MNCLKVTFLIELEPFNTVKGFQVLLSNNNSVQSAEAVEYTDCIFADPHNDCPR